MTMTTVRRVGAAAAILAVAALPAGSATDEAPQYTIDDIVTVAACYRECTLAYDDRAHEIKADLPRSGNTANLNCRSIRNALNAIRMCETSCNESWTALHKPPSKLRTTLREMLDADETDFDAMEECHRNNSTAHVRTRGIRIVY